MKPTRLPRIPAVYVLAGPQQMTLGLRVPLVVLSTPTTTPEPIAARLRAVAALAQEVA